MCKCVRFFVTNTSKITILLFGPIRGIVAFSAAVFSMPATCNADFGWFLTPNFSFLYIQLSLNYAMTFCVSGF